VLFVANVERVAAFYAAIGAMNLVTRDPEHAVLAIEGFQLVIHRLRGEPEPHIDADGKVRVREDSYAKICLPVDRIDAARSRAVAHGGFIKPAQQEWQVRDFRACDGNDPEGNVIQVRESVA
jgi:predicted enzyme related to lactoylglutathione lyase